MLTRDKLVYEKGLEIHCHTLLRYDILELREMGGGCRNAGCGSCGKELECFATQGKDLASAYVLCPHLGTRCLNL